MMAKPSVATARLDPLRRTIGTSSRLDAPASRPPIMIGGLLAGASSLLLVPIVRLKGSSLAVATLGFAIIVHLVMMNEDWLTGGSIGLMDIPHPTLFGFPVGGETAFY